MPRRMTAFASSVVGFLVPCVLAAQSSVVGTVRDSLSATVVPGATVQLVLRETPGAPAHTVIADTTGAFRIEGLAPGSYLLGFSSPRLDSLGLEASPRTVDVPSGASEVHADLAIPSGSTIAATICGVRHDGTGVLLGQVLDAERGDAAVAAGAVIVRWSELRVGAGGVRRELVQVRAAVASEGRYAACGVPTAVPLSVRAVATGPDSAASGEVELTIDSSAVLMHRDLLVASAPQRTDSDTVRESPGDTSAPATMPTTTPAAGRRGTARLVGHVRQMDGGPAVGARVVVHGVRAFDSLAVAGTDGAYRLDALPGGTVAVEALMLGNFPARAVADLRPGREATLDLVTGARVPTLDPVLVTAKITPTSAFAKRMRQATERGDGYFLVGDQVERRAGRFVSDALLTVPTLRLGDVTIDATGRERRSISSRGRCSPTFYLDGSMITDGVAGIDDLVRPSEVGGVEVYTGATLPPQYGGGRACAVVLVWTKGSSALQ